MSVDDLRSLLQNGGGYVVLAIVFVLLAKGTLIARPVYDERVADWQRERTALIRDRDDWKEIALTGAQAAERAVGLAERRRVRSEPPE